MPVDKSHYTFCYKTKTICQNKQYRLSESYGTYSVLSLSSSKQQLDNSLSHKYKKSCSSSICRIPEFITFAVEYKSCFAAACSLVNRVYKKNSIYKFLKPENHRILT